MDRPTHGNCIRWLFAGQAEKERKKTGWQRDTNGFRIGIGYIHIVRRRVSNDFLCFLHLPPPPGVEKRQNACEQGIENGGQHPLVQFDNKRCRDSTWCDGMMLWYDAAWVTQGGQRKQQQNRGNRRATTKSQTCWEARFASSSSPAPSLDSTK
eukprot:1161064-Pelagomonas_calceolata.AAC.4